MLWKEDESAAFMRSREQYGKLSNMAGGFPLVVHSVYFSGPEAVYQALKYPTNIEAQLKIAGAFNGMASKYQAYDKTIKDDLREDWDSARVTAMKIALLFKLLQHKQSFKAALLETQGLMIVEKSFRDSFWGARPVEGGYEGDNMLGMCLMQLRDCLRFPRTEDVIGVFLPEYFMNKGLVHHMNGEEIRQASFQEFNVYMT